MHSNLIFGSYGYRSLAIFRVHAAERQVMMLTLWKDLLCAEKVAVMKLRFFSSPRHVVELYAILVFCLGCRAGSERFASAQFQLWSRRQRALEVYPSIWENSALLGKLGSFSVTLRPWEATQEATHFAVLAFCTHSSKWLLFGMIFGKVFSVPRTFGSVFRDQWGKYFQTRKGCNKQKCFFFLIKTHL